MAHKTAENRPLPALLIKGVLLSTIAAILLITLFAVALQQGWLGAESVPTVTTVIKVLCAALCSLVVIVKYQRRRWLAGALAGALFSVAAFCCFSLLSASFNVDLLLLADIAIGALSGALTAMRVNLAGK